MLNQLARAIRDDSGQDLIEYALLTSFVGLAAFAGVSLLSTAMNNFYSNTDAAGQSDLLVEVPDPQ